MGNELVVQDSQPQPVMPMPANLHGVPTSHELLAYQAYAKTAVESQMYRGINKEAGVMMIILAAREYGISPCQALNNGIRIIEGNVELSARMMSALIRRSKHQLKVSECSDTKCTIWGKRRDTGEELTVTYTIDMAQKAGLIKDKGAWKKTPEDMLFARAVSRLSRQLFSDVVGIGYIEGEIDDTHVPEEPAMAAFEIEHVPEIKEAEEQKLLEELFGHLDKEDRYLMNEFIEIVRGHYKWDRCTCIKEFLKDLNKTIDRFHVWKNNKKK